MITDAARAIEKNSRTDLKGLNFFFLRGISIAAKIIHQRMNVLVIILFPALMVAI